MRAPDPKVVTAIDPDDWADAVADVGEAQLVVGGPGTGKSEFLVRRALHLLENCGATADRITVLGFSRRGVAEIRDRIRSALPGSVGPLDVTTFHSYSARLLETRAEDAGWNDTPQILTGPEQVAVVHDLLRAEDPADWSPAFGQLLTTQTLAKEMTDFILRAAEQMRGPDEIAAYRRADWRGVPEFLALYAKTLRATNRIDYGTLVAVAAELVEADHGTDQPPLRYLLVDEYQDTTPAQVRLLQGLQAQNHRILAAADPYQSIYSFRGATLENVASFENDFTTPGSPAKRMLLTTSFRTPRAILDTAVSVTTGDLPGATGAVIPAPGAGAVETHVFDQQVEEAEWIAAEAQRLHLTERIPYSRIGVFVRSKRRLLSDLSRALERRRIPHDLPGTRLNDQPAVRFVLDLVTGAAGPDGPAATDRAVRRVLLGARVGLTIGSFRSVQRRFSRTGSWAAAIRGEVPEWSGVADLLDDPTWADEVPAVVGLWRIWSELPGVEALVADPNAGEERAAWRSLAQVLARWEERNPSGTLLDYRNLAEAEDFEAQPLLSYRKPAGDRLTLTTLHQAKGLELDVAFIADAVDGVFPDLRSRDSLLGTRHLLANVPTETPAYRAFRLQEESRLAYTAMTRARRRVIWTATERGLDDGPGRPSRFFTRMVSLLGADPSRPRDLISLSPTPGERPPVTVSEAEATLRRTMVDPAMPPPIRLAALTLLAEGDRWGLRSPLRFGGVPERGPDNGLLSGEPVLSPSQAQSYEQCPRRYALERRLRIGSDTSIYAAFGTLIHDVLEAAEKAALDSGKPRSDRDDAIEELERLFDPEDFGGEPFAESWAQRAVSGLTHLYDNWPAPRRRAALLEYSLNASISGHRWVGRADRIDVSNDGVTIVDYKTSKQPLPTAEAAESLQLGFYALASLTDRQVAAHGPVIGAEFWYPLAKAQRTTTRRFDMRRLEEVESRLTAAATGIIAEDWTPVPGNHCERCDLQRLCPAWPEGGARFV